MASLKSSYDGFTSRWQDAMSALYSTFYRMSVAADKLSADDPVAAGAQLKSAASNLYSFWTYMANDSPFTDSVHYYLREAFIWIDENWPSDGEEYELTWQKIIEAWIANDFEGRAATIATIDRMRQILWDEPFYVAWAARPEDQEF